MAWWILTTGPSLERRATASLIEAGFEAWSPMRLVRFKTRYMSKAAEREYPTFPGYAFVRPGDDPDDTWHRIRAIEEVRAILCNAGRAVSLGDLEMARVREHLEGIAAKPVDADVWRKDDFARIVAGPWIGFEGLVVDTSKLARRGSVQVLLSLFGRQTATEIAVDQLERAA